jgi:hypothetical protein
MFADGEEIVPNRHTVRLPAPDEPTYHHITSQLCGLFIALGAQRVTFDDDGVTVVDAEGGLVHYSPGDEIVLKTNEEPAPHASFRAGMEAKRHHV